MGTFGNSDTLSPAGPIKLNLPQKLSDYSEGDRERILRSIGELMNLRGEIQITVVTSAKEYRNE
jgi:hypothetical protein